MIAVWAILGAAAWALILGWLVSPWLTLAGAVVLTLGVVLLNPPPGPS